MSLRGLAIAALAAGLGTAFATLASAPPGWVIAGTAPADYEFAVDTTTAASGKASASITAKRGARSDGFGTLMQTIAADDYRGARWRLSGYLRTDAANRAQMWMRVDGSGGKVLAFDNMDSRPVTGTTAWTRYNIVLDVPSDSIDIAFGFFLISSGKVWGDDFRLEKVDATVRVTAAGPTLPRVPANPSFEDADSSQTVVWTARKLRIVYDLATTTCEWLYGDVKRVLLALGARASDLDLREYECFGDRQPGLDATFSVLAPTDTTGKNAAGELLEGRWQTVEIRLDTVPRDEIITGSRLDRTMPVVRQRLLVQLVKQKILPLFPAKSVEFNDDNVLRVQVLKPWQE